MRTTIDDIIAILDETSLDEEVIEAFGNSASVFVTSSLGGKELSDEILAEIEKWVAAHMISSTRERMAKEEGAGGAYIKYAGTTGQGLNSTPYGQMAISLDTTGTLQALALLKGKAYTKAIPNFE